MTATSTAIAGSEWGECLVPVGIAPPALAAEIRQAMGVVPDWAARIAPCPWVARAFCRLATKPIAHMPGDLWDLIGLVVSQDNSCRYCFGIQRTFFRIFGYSEERIAQLARDFHLAAIPPAHRVALEFARRVSRASPRPRAEEIEQLARAGFSQLAIAEIAFAAAVAAFMNRLATLLALPPESMESMVERRWFKLMRPLIAWRMRDKPQPFVPSTPTNGLFDGVVRRLEGSPSALVLRRTIDEAFDSQVLPVRTKALMVAVIAKALGCSASEIEARALAERSGLASRDVDEVLASLASSRLDERERRLVPFARETVRYDVTRIQRRTAEVMQGLTVEEILEAVGILGLGNCLGRLSVLLDAC